MPSTSPTQRHQARRALIDDVRVNRRGWLQHGVAALAVSAVGLGVAGSLALTGGTPDAGAAARTQAATAAAVEGGAARDGAAAQTSRSSARTALDPAKVKSLADQRAEELAKTDDKITAAAAGKQVDQREQELAETSDAAQEQAKKIASGQKSDDPAPADKPAATTGDGDANGKSCLPAAHYRVAATFGQVGSWARYHTGFDFSAPIGTTLRAPSSGVVTNAGRGPASGWAGNYVAIKYPDGTQSLMAHMSTVSVQVGQSVSGCQTVGAVGMTGRTFGPHVHFEIYPAGITPGDVYRAVNPLGWLKAHGLNP
ncbi:Murein DD-endopeptidase MepM and murein hydrolase activator NlpD, contain LysM domain [Microlunatus sagamiharensis]|uniref:Murein DD-endopeptidase MepM and murein hydrolase activator NlpD, contain LysM domain n=1 Tax=Microlunatus sagamiharensis TaxID=546874 RepID=A0A1H2LHU0_9ACTN|nr:M23 family metallopeptidase [Microlunatus sagamiharensis]SDU80590.1 Murein DD-endopeptidase MepM and murein hydrolase activator NlpD, contain LysM domain [Microlunatus sagamiharensis]